MPDLKIPLSDLDYGTAEEEAVLRVLRSGWISTGPEVKLFEAEIADLVSVRHAVAVANGTAALHLALLALGIGPGDEVIQPAVNFVAAANMTRAVGATAVFADIVDVVEPVIDPSEVERLIGPQTRAVIIMHYGGYATRLYEVAAVCRKRGVALIEDACHALGSHAHAPDPSALAPLGNRSSAVMAGSLGDVACFSFFSNKNLAIGEGGMVVTDRDDLGAAITRLRSHGMTSLSWDRHHGHASTYDVIMNGYNYRMDDLRGALGRTQLAKLARNNDRRRDAVRAYRHWLRQVEGLVLPFTDAMVESSACHLMTVLAPSPAARRSLAGGLHQQGIQTSLHYPCVTSFSAFEKSHSDASGKGLVKSFDYAARTLTLPLYPTLTPPQIEMICCAVESSCRRGTNG